LRKFLNEAHPRNSSLKAKKKGTGITVYLGVQIPTIWEGQCPHGDLL